MTAYLPTFPRLGRELQGDLEKRAHGTIVELLEGTVEAGTLCHLTASKKRKRPDVAKTESQHGAPAP